MGGYIITHAYAVINGDIRHGTFIAMLSVFSEVSADFSEGYKEFLKITSMGGTLRYITFMLNRETDLFIWKHVNRKRRESTRVHREQILKEKGSDHPFPTDMIAFELKNVGYSHKAHRILHGINVTVRQGSVVAIMGQHGQARQTFLKLMAHEIFPTEGEIFIPTHLRILHVSQEVYIMNLSVLQNLTFGHPEACPERMMKILRTLEAWKLLEEVKKSLKHIQEKSLSNFESEAESEEYDDEWLPCCESENAPEEDEELTDGKWVNKVSYSEKAKLHLARALVMNPEVMVLQRPLLHFNDGEERCVMDLLSEHVHNRGIGFPPESVYLRRPRTIFMSVESEEQGKQADVLWSMQDHDCPASMAVVRDS